MAAGPPSRRARNSLCGNTKANGADIYHHFADVLKRQRFDFLIPDDHYDDLTDSEGIGRFLNEALDAWFTDGRAELFVRIFNTYPGTLLDKQFSRVSGMSANVESACAFTVTADGLLRIDDTLRSTSDEIVNPVGHVRISRSQGYLKILLSKNIFH